MNKKLFLMLNLKKTKELLEVMVNSLVHSESASLNQPHSSASV